MQSPIRLFLSAVALLLSTIKIVAEVPPNVPAFLKDESNAIREDGFLPSRMPASMDFVRSVTSNWRDILQELPTLATDGRKQSLVIVAAEFLPPPDYIEFINQLCVLRAQNKLVPEALRFVLWANMGKSGFLAYNFDQPQLASALHSLENQMTRDYPNDWRDFFADIKSGKMKARLIERRQKDGDGMLEPITNFDGAPYRQLAGGSVEQDVKLIASRPVEAVTSLASSNRVRWSMIVAFALVIGAAFGLVLLAIKVLRQRMKPKSGRGGGS